jgi:hypothetical protein
MVAYRIIMRHKICAKSSMDLGAYISLSPTVILCQKWQSKMSWLASKKSRIIDKLKSNYIQLNHHALQIQIPLTKMERL